MKITSFLLNSCIKYRFNIYNIICCHVAFTILLSTMTCNLSHLKMGIFSHKLLLASPLQALRARVPHTFMNTDLGLSRCPINFCDKASLCPSAIFHSNTLNSIHTKLISTKTTINPTDLLETTSLSRSPACQPSTSSRR